MAGEVRVGFIGSFGLSELFGKFWVGLGAGVGPRHVPLLDPDVVEDTISIEDALSCIGCGLCRVLFGS